MKYSTGSGSVRLPVAVANFYSLTLYILTYLPAELLSKISVGFLGTPVSLVHLNLHVTCSIPRYSLLQSRHYAYMWPLIQVGIMGFMLV